MQDIKPDTSLYTDLPNKLRAFAAILESGVQAQCNTTAAPNGLQWTDPNTPLPEQLEFLVSGVDYRAKPKPRELWAVQRPDGSYWPDQFHAGKPMIYTREPICGNHNTPVRFVEQPE